jgi:hypothetical protein
MTAVWFLECFEFTRLVVAPKFFRLPLTPRRHFRFLAVSSAKPDDIFWKTFEETLFSLNKQVFFKYFPGHTLVLEKTGADDVVCSSLGLNELTL